MSLEKYIRIVGEEKLTYKKYELQYMEIPMSQWPEFDIEEFCKNCEKIVAEYKDNKDFSDYLVKMASEQTELIYYEMESGYFERASWDYCLKKYKDEETRYRVNSELMEMNYKIECMADTMMGPKKCQCQNI